MEKKSNVLMLERGKPPQSMMVNTSAEAIAAVIGEGPTTWLPIRGDARLSEVFFPVVMVCLTEDVAAMERDGEGIPRMGLVCGVDGNDLVSLPEVLHTRFKELYTRQGDRMLLDGDRERASREAAQRPGPSRLLPFPVR